ncbi:MAG: addiction module protein [Acidiferrobacterales bacterium]|nr:addiction module protein [Acidiferrobacterales bacterium]
MSHEEKVRVMELLWDDLCRDTKGIVSPSWHKGVLKGREKAVDRGDEKFIEWEEAKRQISEEI